MAVETTAQTREPIFTRDFTLVFLANLANFLGFYLLMATLPTYVTGIVGKPWVAGMILGIFGIVGMLVRPFVGRLADLRGGKGLMLAGAAMLIATMLLFGLAHSAASLFTLRVMQGVGWATFSTATSAVIALIAPAKRRGEAMGYFGISTSVAMAVAPAIGLLIAKHGYPLLFLASAVLVAVAGLHVVPVGNRRAETQLPVNGLGAFVLRSALFPSLVVGVSTLTYASVVFYIQEYAKHFHLGDAGLFFTVLAAALICTRGPLGRLSDRIGREWVIGGGLLCSAAGTLLLAVLPDRWMLLVVAAIYGLGTAAVQPTLMALAADRAAPARRGAAMGTYTTAFDLGIGAGAALWGWVIGALGFRSMFAISAGMCVVALVVLAAGSNAARLAKAGKTVPLPE